MVADFWALLFCVALGRFSLNDDKRDPGLSVCSRRGVTPAGKQTEITVINTRLRGNGTVERRSSFAGERC